ncbi:uncharacterized protein K452DRAFT_12732 [Aplosporella prunicola CBS 121167]|uniref:Uncharacterized protein n=1 Tax=Aplosporella prunicola CBS 121167 TaxID=1176127 RepID=A0A6A6BFG0_9PEZI|nr:uncharacterized protein K452DRAFT_12732 [Aplosporella prunicola CBS 121167]KAF2142902.1 hypothetical protein K452DRAFT_12732 [Aplosporella prunicola CBS 121167]
MYGALFSTTDGRFASKSNSHWCSFSIDGRPVFDNGLLGDMPALTERHYLSWLQRDDSKLAEGSQRLGRDSVIDEDAMDIDSGDMGNSRNMDNMDSRYRYSSITPTSINHNGGAISAFIPLNGINKENIPTTTSTDSLSSASSPIADLPEDFFFMKSSERDIPTHYACGMSYKPGGHHVNIGRCTGSAINRFQDSKYQHARARPWRSPQLTSLTSSTSSSESTSSLPSSIATLATTPGHGNAQEASGPYPVYVRDSNGKLWLDLGSVDYGNELIAAATATAANKREPTPVHEMRDFYYERDAESSTPVFYGTGRQTISHGWAARMGMET